VEESGDDALYGAAYEDVTYQDAPTTMVEGEVLGGEPREEFDLEGEGERLEKRLRFLSTVARLWNVASRASVRPPPPMSQRPPSPAVLHGSGAETDKEALRGWLGRARKNYQGLLALMTRSTITPSRSLREPTMRSWSSIDGAS